MPGTFLVVAAIAALVDVVVLRSLFAAEGFTTAASLVLAKVVALLAAAGVRFVLYRAVLLGAVRRGLQARTARTPAGGSVRASIVVPALDEAEGIASAISELRTALADLAADGGVEVVVVDDGSDRKSTRLNSSH